MNDKSNISKHLIDDFGVHHNLKHTQASVFIFICRIATIGLIILGLVALYVGNL